MPKICFLIPASPTRGFLSQIAAFQAAIRSFRWSRWKAEFFICFGGEPEAGAVEQWRPHLRETTMGFAPNSGPEENPFYYAQIDGLFRRTPDDVDVFARMDADTLPVGDFEDLLDHVSISGEIAGVMAHFTFPLWQGTTSREVWREIADGLITQPLEFRYAYSLANASVAEVNRIAPFYLNDGVVFFPQALFREYSQRYLSLRPLLMEKLRYPYFSGQIALALAVAEMRARTCALPMRYNFPNDERAEKKFPEELENVKIFHYLRTEQFDRQLIFADAEQYQNFLRLSLTGSNRVFQQNVERIFGSAYPFS